MCQKGRFSQRRSQLLSWSLYISDIVTKASRTLNFIKRNLSKSSSQVKKSAYLMMVNLIYNTHASDVWDPHHVKDIMELEKIQQRAAHWALNDYGIFSSVTSMLNQLSWPTLQTRCKESRLHSYIAQSILSSVITYNPSILYLPAIRSTTQYHPLHYISPYSSTTAHQNSCFSTTISDWSMLQMKAAQPY